MPVLPLSGSPGAGQSWPRFLFLHVHAGPFGGHRICKGTIVSLSRLATFPNLERRVEEWCNSCWVCLRFRSQPHKIQAVFAPRYRLPFHHVMIDVEGRITPADIDGAAYVLTYVCVTTGAPLFESMASVKHADLRRALMKCVCRAKTWPMLVAHDRGKGFVNALMEELWSLLGVEQRVGNAWRLVEQPLVERVHQG